MDNYPQFEPGPEEGADLVYMKGGVAFGKYNKVMIDHVIFYFSEDSEYKGIKPEELNELLGLP
jgi:hypothetical protein